MRTSATVFSQSARVTADSDSSVRCARALFLPYFATVLNLAFPQRECGTRWQINPGLLGSTDYASLQPLGEHRRAAKDGPDFFRSFTQTPAAHEVVQRVEQGECCAVTGVGGSGTGFLAAILARLYPATPVVVVTAGLKLQEAVHQDMETWSRLLLPTASGNQHPLLLFCPAWEVLPHEGKLPHADVISERLETLAALAQKNESGPPQPLLISASVAALQQRTLGLEQFRAGARRLKAGDRLEPLDLIEWLEASGYEPEAQVTQKGELALRGGIVDVYPLTSPWPVRLEFFGDELESLRYFDPATQVSREVIQEIVITPGGELGILKQAAQESSANRASASLLDYLPVGTIFLLQEPERLRDAAQAALSQAPWDDHFFIRWDKFQADARAKGCILISSSEFGDQHSSLEGTAWDLDLRNLEAYRPIAERRMDQQIVETQRREFFSQMHRWLRQGYEVDVVCNNDGEQQRFREIWTEYGFGQGPNAPGVDAAMPRVCIGALTRGFIHEPGKWVVITDAEIFGRYKVQRPRRLKSVHATAARSALDIDFTQLEPGDYVVHLQHGIGRYTGLDILPPGQGAKGSKTRTEGEAEECLVIEYASADPGQPGPRLYVPVQEAHLVSKYVGTGKSRPPLNTLGGTRWAKTKAQAENAVRDLASEMLAIQAARETKAGHTFAPDNTWQREFESSFLFEETPDQMRAIVAAKTDMESAKPMDRLICGDVGYGKTEVAIRAAFKAVMGGKQVAILVPTTILAQQHFNTFRERMADYPIQVEQISRFRSRRDQQRVVAQMADGSVDIVIGTHRLLQNDIAFKDLGLVVIDEEQRFGVLHKEKFKLLRRMVDVLTLSATPIPRTLYLALTGARDMSTIETPPQDRLPVETIVTQYDERVIRDAVQREINRQGQVYYLHNRVFDIEEVALRIRSLVPSARVIVGHGQMESDDLEDVMARFINGEADVLVSTTIIESGIDIPNANTIIIDRADRFGLSDLYQLRGRVGRYKHQAFAYLLLPRHAGLLADARKRIGAIKQYSSLGSGLKIAMRDLEIRGAGNLLGAQQSGHITAVGFELYCQLLKQSVSALKGEKVKPRFEVVTRLDFLTEDPGGKMSEAVPAARSPSRREKLNIQVPRETWAWKQEGRERAGEDMEECGPLEPACLPQSYIADPQQRIEIYRKLAQANARESLSGLKAELRDRFGKPPAAVELLLQVAEIKLLAHEKEVLAIETKAGKVMLTRRGDFVMAGGKFPRLTKKDAKGKLSEIKKLLLGLG